MLADPVVTVRIDGVGRQGHVRVVDDADERRRVGDVMGAKYVYDGDPSIGLTYESWCYDVPAVAIEFGEPRQVAWSDVSQRFYVETLGCPKNQVDSDKLIGNLLADGLLPAAEPEDADLVVVNTCAFIDAARQESIDTVLALDERRRTAPGSS